MRDTVLILTARKNRFQRELLKLGKLLKSLPSFWREAFVKIVGTKLEFEEGYRNPL